MPINQTTLRSSGGSISVEIAFGYAHWAQYKITLLDTHQQLARVIGEGANTDTIPDIFPLNVPPPGYFLSFLAVVATYTPGQTQPFSTTLSIKQGGVVVPGGLIVDTGTFDKAVYSVGITQLNVVP
jgi:hypothetical protein